MGSNNPRMRIAYTPITNDLTTQAVNQITALLERADALLHSISSSPNFNSQSISAFFSQPGRAQWMLMIQRDGTSAGVASGPMVPQHSSELRGLTKQVQAISSKLGAIQAQLQKPDKTYAAVAGGAPTKGPPVPPKPTHEPLTHACLVLVPQIPLPADFNADIVCQKINAILLDPSEGASHPEGPIPLLPVLAPGHLSAISRTAKGNLVVTGYPGISADQLTTLLPYIKPILDHGFGVPVESFSGTKWRCVCINRVPTPLMGPAYTSGNIKETLLHHNQWSNNRHMPIQPYWIHPPSTIKPGHM